MRPRCGSRRSGPSGRRTPLSCRRQRRRAPRRRSFRLLRLPRKGRKRSISTPPRRRSWETLPGIGAERARNIIADREANGPFRIVEDLTRVPGIGEGDPGLAAGRCDCIVGRSSHENIGSRRRKVLVKGIKFNLQSEGYQVETAYDGEAAVEGIAAGPSISSSWT